MEGSFGYNDREFKEVLARVSQSKYQTDLIISKKVKLDKAIEEGFKELTRPDKQAAKILIEI